MAVRDGKRQVLQIIRELNGATGDAIAGKLTVSPEHVAKLCNSLIEDGYLSRNGRGAYILTAKGKQTLGPPFPRVIRSFRRYLVPKY